MHPLEQILEHEFNDSDLLLEALTHPSAAQDEREGRRDNQRLEFLGDSVLGLILTEELFRRYPDNHEGELTPLRAQLVSGAHLAELALELNLGVHLELGPGEETSGGRERKGALADAFESLTGALYLDAGLDPVRAFILTRFKHSLNQVIPGASSHNPKGRLQEILQTIADETPAYLVLSEEGLDHEPLFQVEVSWQSKILGHGSGRRKKQAEAAAACDAIERSLWTKS